MLFDRQTHEMSGAVWFAHADSFDRSATLAVYFFHQSSDGTAFDDGPVASARDLVAK